MKWLRVEKAGSLRGWEFAGYRTDQQMRNIVYAHTGRDWATHDYGPVKLMLFEGKPLVIYLSRELMAELPSDPYTDA